MGSNPTSSAILLMQNDFVVTTEEVVHDDGRSRIRKERWFLNMTGVMFEARGADPEWVPDLLTSSVDYIINDGAMSD